MAKWIRIDPDEFNKPRQGANLAIRLYVSPYDLPESMAGNYDEELKQLVIRFIYTQEPEPLEKVRTPEPIIFMVGKRSKRLYQIHVDVDKLKVKSVGLEVVGKEISHLSEAPERQLRADNYGIAKQVLQAKEKELLKALPD